MKCKQMQELILSDYLDNELSLEHRLMIEGHLSQCPQCHQLAQEAKILNQAFLNTADVSLDKKRIWQNIVTELDQEPSTSVIYSPNKPVGEDALSALARLFKPALALGMLASLVLAVTLITFPAKISVVQAPPEEEQYLAYLADEIVLENQIGADFGEDFGTDLEAYFL